MFQTQHEQNLHWREKYKLNYTNVAREYRVAKVWGPLVKIPAG